MKEPLPVLRDGGLRGARVGTTVRGFRQQRREVVEVVSDLSPRVLSHVCEITPEPADEFPEPGRVFVRFAPRGRTS